MKSDQASLDEILRQLAEKSKTVSYEPHGGWYIDENHFTYKVRVGRSVHQIHQLSRDMISDEQFVTEILKGSSENVHWCEEAKRFEWVLPRDEIRRRKQARRDY